MLRGRSVEECSQEGLTLLLYSDGSFIDKGIASRAAYGWQVWGFMEEEEMKGMTSGGVVHGDPLLLDSTRAEHHGALAVLILAYLLGWRGKVIITLDNSAVDDRMAGASEMARMLPEDEVKAVAQA